MYVLWDGGFKVRGRNHWFVEFLFPTDHPLAIRKCTTFQNVSKTIQGISRTGPAYLSMTASSGSHIAGTAISSATLAQLLGEGGQH